MEISFRAETKWIPSFIVPQNGESTTEWKDCRWWDRAVSSAALMPICESQLVPSAVLGAGSCGLALLVHGEGDAGGGIGRAGGVAHGVGVDGNGVAAGRCASAVGGVVGAAAAGNDESEEKYVAECHAETGLSAPYVEGRQRRAEEK